MKSEKTIPLLLASAVILAGAFLLASVPIRITYPVIVVYPSIEAAPKPTEQLDIPAEEGDISGDWFGIQGEPAIYLHFPLELNEATVEELVHIPRVGEATAQRIVQYREVLEGYTELEQLMEIRGIGEITYQQISPYLYLEEDSIPNRSTEGSVDDSNG